MAMRSLDDAAHHAADGYYLARGLFSEAECDVLTAHFMKLREEDRPGDFAGVDLTSEDPLKRYPRMIHMHHWDEASLRWGLDKRIGDMLQALLGEEAFLVQTMLYFKPAGARGQALHQDQFYLKAKPGTCMAAWLALDRCDEENGCLQVVPGTADTPILCLKRADTTQSFTDVTVPVPEGMNSVPVIMERGDVLFFNGAIIHGSYPNTSKDRFRRSLIGHYITSRSTEVESYYHPIHRFDGSTVELSVAHGGGPCGVWVDKDGVPVVEMDPRGQPKMEDLHE